MNYEDECRKALAEARAYIKKTGPYFSTLIYGLIPRMAPGCGTMGVTKGLVLYVDPEWFMEQKPDIEGNEETIAMEASKMRAGLLVHEAMHILRGVERLEKLPDHHLANLAADLAINADLVKAGWMLPKNGAYIEKFGFPPGLALEQYYELLEKQVKEQSDGDGPSGSGSPGTDTGRGKHKSKSGGTSSCSSPDKESGKHNSITDGCCGGCAGNDKNKELEDKLDAECGRTKVDVQRIKKEAVRQIRDATAQGRGSFPGNFEELFIQGNGKSIIPWKSRLAAILRKATGRIVCGMADFSMRRPSKRSYTRGVIRPGMIDRRVEVAFVLDTSGSMGMEQLQAGRIEIAAIFAQLGIADAWYSEADADIAFAARRVRMRDLYSLPIHGRGGTDFRPALEAVQRLRPRPDICIYLTDGDGTAPETPPKGMAVVWCLVPSSYGRRPAEWGHTVVLSDDAELLKPYES